MTITLSASVPKSEKNITNAMFRVIIKGLNKQLVPLKRLIKNDIAKEIPAIFKNPQYDTDGIYSSLVGGAGKLNFEFGFPKGSEASIVDEILLKIASSIFVDFNPLKPFGDGTTGGFVVKILQSDFQDILNLPAAIVQNISKNPEAPKELPWLDWLLLRGDAIIIEDYIIEFTTKAPQSRSGGAIMIRENTGAWVVPLFAKGTIRDNWLFNTVMEAQDFLQGLSKGVIDKHVATVLN